MRAFPLLVLALLLAPVAQAASYPDPQKAPRYFESTCIQAYDRRFVYDYLGLMDDELGRLVEAAACDVYAKTSAHFVLVLVQDTGDESLESYALHLYERWGIGSKDTNDGVLLLYVNSYNLSGRSSALRVEVGYGLEGTLNARIANDAIRVARDAKDRSLAAGDDAFYARSLGLAAGADYILETLNDSYVDGHFPAPAPTDGGAPPWWFWAVAVVFALILLRALGAAAGGARGWGYQTGSSSAWQGAVAGMFVREMMRRPPGGGGFGGGGGGWGGGGFGGGRSGGGGGSGGF